MRISDWSSDVCSSDLDLVRHTPSLWNARLQRWFGWDGAADSLWAAAIRPILSEAEMGGSIARTAAVIREDDVLSRRFAAASGAEAGALPDEAVLVLAAQALAAFQEPIVSARAPFDAFRDALRQGQIGRASGRGRVWPS